MLLTINMHYHAIWIHLVLMFGNPSVQSFSRTDGSNRRTWTGYYRWSGRDSRPISGRATGAATSVRVIDSKATFAGRWRRIKRCGGLLATRFQHSEPEEQIWLMNSETFMFFVLPSFMIADQLMSFLARWRGARQPIRSFAFSDAGGHSFDVNKPTLLTTLSIRARRRAREVR